MYLTLAATVLLMALALPAQNPDGDRAVATFRQAVAQYNAMDFAAAKDTFLKVDRDRLSKSDKASLDDYLSKIDLAVRRQAAAMMAYNAGVKALRANDAAKAREQLELAAASEYLPEAVRRDAKAQLALVAKTAPAAATSQPAAPAVRLEVPSPTTRPAGAEAAGTSQDAGKVLGGVLERRAKANVLMTEGKQALANGDSKTAAAKFEQAVALVPEMEEAQQLLQQARALNTEQAGPLTVLEQKRQIRRQQTDVEFDRALKHASELLLSANSAADFDAASESARLAENVLQANRNLYTIGEYRDKLAAVSKQLDGIQSRRRDWEQAQVQKQLDQMARAEAERARRVRQQLDQQIATLTENAKTLREEQKYAESLEAVRQILRLQPTNSWAADQEAVLRQFILLQDQKDIVKTRQTEEIRTMTDLQESAIPWYETIIFPRQWREQSQQREGKGIPPVGWEEDRRIRQVLQEGMQTPLDIDVEKPLAEVLKQLEKTWGINIRVKWKYLDKVGYTEEGTMVSPMRLTKVTNEKILRAILDDASDTNVGTPNELCYTVDSGEITVSTRGDLARPITTPEVMQVRVYDTRDILRGWAWTRTNFGALGPVPTNSVDFTYASGGGSGGGGGASSSSSGASTSGGTESNSEPNAVSYEQLRQLIRTTIDPNSWGDPNVTDPNNPPGRINIWNDQLVIRQTPANHAAVADLLNEIRQAKEIQVAIEAKFLSVSTSYLENINVDLDLTLTNLGSHWAGGSISFLQDPSFVQNISTGTGSIGTTLSNLPASTIAGSFLDDLQVTFLIQATEAHQDTRMLTAPRLTLANGTRAAIWVGRTLFYVSQITWTISYITSGTSTIPTYQENVTTSNVNPGTALEIDATVSADLKYVTLRVRPSITQLLALNQVNTGTDPNHPSFIQVPDLAQEWVDTTVTVPDGGTLLLGGLKSLGEVEKEEGVPVLSKIPIINRGFTNRAKVKDDSTLLILIKPIIIIPRDDEKRLFP
jgi:general secretion pathway protein D